MFRAVQVRAVLVGLTALMLIGCGRQVARTIRADDDAETLAVGPDREALARAAPPDYVVDILDASGGISAWVKNSRLHAVGVVKLYRPDDSFYLTQHEFEVYPWSDAVRISASEPRGKLVWQMVAGRFEMLEGAPGADVSPLYGAYAGYADAFLQIVTAPVRLLDRGNQLERRPVPVRMDGQWYERIEVKFGPGMIAAEKGGRDDGQMSQPYWTDGVFYLNRAKTLIDRIWLGNAATEEYLMVRGYDYSMLKSVGVRVPAKVEIFRAGPDGTVQHRLAEIDIK
jgi:hypothetical protein